MAYGRCVHAATRVCMYMHTLACCLLGLACRRASTAPRRAWVPRAAASWTRPSCSLAARTAWCAASTCAACRCVRACATPGGRQQRSRARAHAPDARMQRSCLTAAFRAVLQAMPAGAEQAGAHLHLHLHAVGSAAKLTESVPQACWHCHCLALHNVCDFMYAFMCGACSQC